MILNFTLLKVCFTGAHEKPTCCRLVVCWDPPSILLITLTNRVVFYVNSNSTCMKTRNRPAEICINVSKCQTFVKNLFYIKNKWIKLKGAKIVNCVIILHKVVLAISNSKIFFAFFLFNQNGKLMKIIRNFYTVILSVKYYSDEIFSKTWIHFYVTEN